MTNNIQNPSRSLSFGEAVKTCFNKYVTFSGRARRSEYWYFYLFNTICGFVALGIDMALGTFSWEDGMGIVYGIYALAVLLPGLAVTFRRLHDTNRSAWWLLIGIIPLLGAIVLLVFLVQDSKPETNRFGASPKYSGGNDWV